MGKESAALPKRPRTARTTRHTSPIEPAKCYQAPSLLPPSLAKRVHPGYTHNPTWTHKHKNTRV